MGAWLKVMHTLLFAQGKNAILKTLAVNLFIF